MKIHGKTILRIIFVVAVITCPGINVYSNCQIRPDSLETYAGTNSVDNRSGSEVNTFEDDQTFHSNELISTADFGSPMPIAPGCSLIRNFSCPIWQPPKISWYFFFCQIPSWTKTCAACLYMCCFNTQFFHRFKKYQWGIWWHFENKLNLYYSQIMRYVLFLCGSLCLLRGSLCNFVSQRSTEKQHRGPQREFSWIIQVNYHCGCFQSK